MIPWVLSVDLSGAVNGIFPLVGNIEKITFPSSQFQPPTCWDSRRNLKDQTDLQEQYILYPWETFSRDRIKAVIATCGPHTDVDSWTRNTHGTVSWAEREEPPPYSLTCLIHRLKLLRTGEFTYYWIYLLENGDY